MARVKRGTKRRARRKKLARRTKGFFLTKSKLYQSMQEAANRADRYVYRDRRVRKRQYRQLWIQRIGAGASFHGGGLVTDKPDSPHLLIPKIRAHFLIAIAESDDQKQPEAKDVLRKAFAQANVPAEIEVYAAKHGWTQPDSAVYNDAEAERAWSRLLALFSTALA